MHLACLSRHCLASDEQKTSGNPSWHDFASSILTSGISYLCLYSAIQLCIKHMAGFLASLESSPSPKQMEFCGNFLSKWNFSGILFGRLLARIAEYLLNGSLRDVKFHSTSLVHTKWAQVKKCTSTAVRSNSKGKWPLIHQLRRSMVAQLKNVFPLQ